MNKTTFLTLTALLLVPPAVLRAAEALKPAGKPNIVYILTDDLGYGDVHCLNPERGKIPTPNIDRFAAQGMMFTDAHASASVCTPSRYSILTGRYNWRSPLQVFVLRDDSRPLIGADRMTLPKMLQQQGYKTVGIGKWHLGFDMPGKGKNVQTEQPIGNGPTTRGFDSFYCIDTYFWGPMMAVQDDRFVGTPRAAGKKADKDEELSLVLPDITARTAASVKELAKSGQPFFLYFAPMSPHKPIVPTKEWQGKSGLGGYADYVMEVDWSIGEVLKALDAAGVADNTLVIVTSDNGCSPHIGVKGLEDQGHFPSAQFRGYKSDIWDGGHRIPFLARWPGAIKPGTTCKQMICEMDLMATCAEFLGVKLPDSAAEDSISYLPLLTGGDKPVRDVLVHHSIDGKFAIRQGEWKLILCRGSGGWTGGGDGEPTQLYDMTKDVGEQTNEYKAHPEIVARLTQLLEKYVADGRSTPGAPQKNDPKKIVIRKGDGPSAATEEAEAK